MKTFTKLGKLFALVLCFTMITGNLSALASSEILTESIDDVDDSEVIAIGENREDDTVHEHEAEEIIVEGLEGIHLSKLEPIRRSVSSCSGYNHNWQLFKVIQKPACGKAGIWKIQCAACGLTATTTSDIYYHDYVNELCNNCGDGIAPESEINNWNYSLDELDSTITLTQYTGSSTDVIVYGKYRIYGNIYSTILNGNSSTLESPFYDKRHTLTSIKMNPGVVSYNCSYLFYDCNNLTSLDLDSFDTSNVSTMYGMFKECSNLTSLDLSSFDTSNVTSMQDMFNNCNKLTSLDLSSFDTSNVTSMRAMFFSCSRLTSLDLSSFDTSNVTSMMYMFCNGNKLASLHLSSFDTSNVTSMYRMFKECHNLTSLDLSSFDTFNVEDMYQMFFNCPNLSAIIVGRSWNPTFADTTDMFTRCGTSTVTLK